MYNLQKHTSNPYLHLKMIGVWKNKCRLLLCQLILRMLIYAKCYLQTEKKLLYCGLPILNFVNYCNVIPLVGNRDLSKSDAIAIDHSLHAVNCLHRIMRM